MATKKTAKPKYPVREATADDAFDLMGIVSAAGGGDKLGEAVGMAIEAFSKGANDLGVRAATVAITDGLNTALRDPTVRRDAKSFIFGLWQPKLTVGEGENYEEAKVKAWAKLPMSAVPAIVHAFYQTDSFTDFLEFFTSMMPTSKDSTDSSTPSNEPTDIQTKTS